MPTLIDFRRRIRSVRNTQKITRAMKLVSAAKLRRAQERVFHARPYASQMMEVLRSLARRTEVRQHPLLELRKEERTLVLGLSGDKGLCGPFNTNAIRLTERFLATQRNGSESQLITIGKKGRDHFRRRHKELAGEYINVFLRVVEYAQAREIAARVIELYEKKEVDAVYVIYNEFKSILAQRLITEKLLPLEGILPTRVEGALAVPGKEAYEKPPAAAAEAPAVAAEVDYIYEQPPAELFNHLLPRYVEVQVYRALLESAAAEQAARMTAMDNATNNASEMIDQLTLNMNKARQAAITRELIEIVSGAAAL
ncbi:MAG TPA: ATP synthase F1 subunit gamma [Candidatus Acidoferrales bacterium]|nr:ATP synthase F1 subunit gamma [Candidatus Acidoferrales bacterium]